MGQLGRGRGAPGGTEDYPGGVATIDEPGERASQRGRRYDPAWDDWNPPRRWPGILITCGIVILFFVVLAWHFRPHVHLKPPVGAVPAGAPGRLYLVGQHGYALVKTYRGTRDAANLPVVSAGHLIIMHAECLCAYNFVVTASSSLGVPVDFPVNATGRFDTELVLSLPFGYYTLSVEASGPWELQLVQPLPNMPTIPTPFHRFSAGNDVIGPFSGADHFMKFAFLGAGATVHVLVLTDEGVAVASPFNGHTELEQAKVFAHLPNPYYLDLDMDYGYWNLRVQHSSGG